MAIRPTLARPVRAAFPRGVGTEREVRLAPHAARCHLGLGALYARTGRREQSEGYLATALAMFHEMEMRYWIEKTEGALKELGETRKT